MTNSFLITIPTIIGLITLINNTNSYNELNQFRLNDRLLESTVPQLWQLTTK